LQIAVWLFGVLQLQHTKVLPAMAGLAKLFLAVRVVEGHQ
jgi:hypothetical protein